MESTNFYVYAVDLHACACSCAHGLVAGRDFYAISMNYLRYFREVFMLFAQKIEP
jgi:hypothetical protein